MWRIRGGLDAGSFGLRKKARGMYFAGSIQARGLLIQTVHLSEQPPSSEQKQN